MADPVETDGVFAVTFGTVLWAVALVVVGILHADLARHGWSSALWVCLAGFCLGLIGIAYCVRRRNAISRDRAR